ncbi:PulJ/GspJ family protein [Candidatus Venteria ishoeyi]|uniref:Prepilin-type N-terminal cleavage/methylation domain-containing protein n=1 Tax=Candidatus Venteria ishoeyi TaxID=1899563 RepID=A0A1H6F6R5_9GAMM|nr:type II secretion system protein [Candidatus Venteria ishoeyi]MDM8545824.1 type II secretion system protein [Candidatus Venteria ishoeyi]SEH04979.1 Uncharacterised protein [Candidatus Venteria ishoeyi]
MNNNRGFTLLEMLVVLVITSLVSMLLFHSLSYVLNLRTRFFEQLEGLQTGTMQQYWFRSSTAAIIPDYEKTPHVFQMHDAMIFQGNEQGFSGLTLAALDQESGIPTQFGWILAQDSGIYTLTYSPQSKVTAYGVATDKPASWPILRWEGETASFPVGFRYLHMDGSWQETWPPPSVKAVNQLPEAILFNGYYQQQPLTWIVRIDGSKTTPQDVRHEW